MRRFCFATLVVVAGMGMFVGYQVGSAFERRDNLRVQLDEQKKKFKQAARAAQAGNDVDKLDSGAVGERLQQYFRD